MQGEHAEEDQLGERGAEQRQREHRRGRLERGHLIRQLEERERRQDQPAGEHRARREHRPGRPGDRTLSVDARARVGERGEDDRERAEDRQVAALGVDPGDDGDADDPDREADRPRSRQALVRQEAQDQQRVEDRHRGLHHRGEPGVDVLLAPGDQPERQSRVQDSEHETVPPRGSQLGERAVASEPPDDVAEQHGGGEQRPEGHHRRGLDLVDRDLDEEVRGAPDGGQQQQHRPVAVHRFTVLAPTPVPSATPASTSTRPASASAVTCSSRKTAP